MAEAMGKSAEAEVTGGGAIREVLHSSPLKEAASATDTTQYLSCSSGTADATKISESLNLQNIVLGTVLSGYVWDASASEWDEFVDEETAEQLQHARSAYSAVLAVPKRNKAEDRSVCGLPVLDPQSKYVQTWACFLASFDLIYTAFLVPVTVGFVLDGRRDVLGLVNLVAGPIYLISMTMGFHTGFIAQRNLHRVVVRKGPNVAKFYINKGTFVVDTISLTTYAFLVLNFILVRIGTGENEALSRVLNSIQFLRMARLTYVVRLAQHVLRSVSGGGAGRSRVHKWLGPAGVYALVIAYMLAFLMNLTASVWFLIGWWYNQFNKVNWIAAWAGDGLPGCNMVQLDWHPMELPAECDGASTFSLSYCYCTSLYWSVTTMTTVGYGDISPTNIGEMIVGMFVMLGGIMTFVILIGSIQDVFADTSDDPVSLLNSKLPAVNRWVDQQNVSDDVKQQINRYYQEVWAHGSSDVGSELFSELPHQLQAAAARDAVGPTLSSIDFFSQLNDEQRALLASKMTPVSVGIGENIGTTGEAADSIWVLKQGQVVVTHPQHEGGLLPAMPTAISLGSLLRDVMPEFRANLIGYRAVSPCQLWQLKVDDLLAVAIVFPEGTFRRLQHRAVELMIHRANVSHLDDANFKQALVTLLVNAKRRLEEADLKPAGTAPESAAASHKATTLEEADLKPAPESAAVSNEATTVVSGVTGSGSTRQAESQHQELCSMLQAVLDKVGSLESRISSLEGMAT